MDIAQPLLELPTLSLIIIVISLYAAYVVFGVAGFGAILVSGPVMAHFLPLTTIVPLLAVIDFSASIANLIKDRRAIAWKEVKPLLACMVIGTLIGAFLLFSLDAQLLLLLFGLLAIFYPCYAISKRLRQQSTPRFHHFWSIPFGVIGGTFSALFGSGGFIYSIYIMSRIEEKVAIRATQSSLIGFSTMMRITVFAIAGIYSDGETLVVLAIIFPIMLIGIYCGRKLAHHLNKAQFLLFIQCIVMASGASLVVRYFPII